MSMASGQEPERACLDGGRRAGRRAVGGAIALLTACVVLAGCTPVGWQSLDPLAHHDPRISSFLGVNFGEDLADVQEKFPDGEVETSPYGAPAYRIVNQRVGPVLYRSVVYEFADGSGMQLVYAKFSSDSAGEMFRSLRHRLGPPATIRRGLAHERVTASWVLSGGETVTYNGKADRLVILGPKGSSLKADIGLREQEST